MIYGVEDSTDLRWKNTKIKRFRSIRQARRWALSLPDQSKIFGHKTFRRLYRMPTGWRPPSKKQLDNLARQNSSSTYPRYANDVLGTLCYIKGEEISPLTDEEKDIKDII